MNKQLLTIATALIAATTMFASNADAGFGIRLGFGGPLPSFVAHGNDYGHGSSDYSSRKRTYRAARHQEKAPVHVTKKAVETTSIAKVDDKPTVAPELSQAESENSSISLASADVVAKSTEPKTVANVSEDTSSKSSDCKKFFPSVGMTLTVPCE
jgi:hypothetical protein